MWRAVTVSAEDLVQNAILRNDDIVVALIGPTGSGKSNFIDKLTRESGKRAGDSLNSCTDTVRAVRIRGHPQKGDRIVLLDTPGFDVTTITDTDVLIMVEKWLSTKSKKPIQLSGVIYFHRTLDNRTNNAVFSYKNLSILEKLCGSRPAQRVSFVTTMWDKVAEHIALKRENELKSKLWKGMLEKGSRIGTFNNTSENAWWLLQPILDQDNSGPARSLWNPRDSKKRSNYSLANPNDIIVAVMGPTGSGKSNLIDILSGQFGKRAGHRLQSCTDTVQAVRLKGHPSKGDRIVLVDTPGFDDTNMSDMQVLGIIADWLATTYRNQVRLSGILYLHRISDNRMSGSPHKNLRMFGKLCGSVAAHRVIMVTTMWDKILPDIGQRREDELRTRFWKHMLENGSRTGRFNNSQESAWKLIEPLIIEEKTETVLVQEELVDLNKRLNETQAGRTLYDTLQELLSEQKEAIRLLAEQAESQDDPKLAKEFYAEYRKIEYHLESTFEQVQALKIPVGRQILLFFSLKKPHALPIRLG